MLVERHELADHRRGELGGEDRGGGAVARHHLVGHDMCGHALGGDLVGGLAEGEHLGLGEEVAHQQVVHGARAVGSGRQVVGGFGETDEVRGHHPRALVQQLVEGVLAVGSRFAPEDLAGVGGDVVAAGGDRLAVGLHRQLLQVGGEAGHVVAVGQDRANADIPEVVVPEADQAEDDRCVAFEGLGAEVLVDHVEAVEELGEAFLADRGHHRQPDRGVDRVPAADPVPEAEHVVGVDAELGHFGGVGADGDEMLCHGVGVGVERLQEPGARGGGVGECLESGEGLRGDDEQCRLGVEVGEGADHVRGVDVGDEVAADPGVDVVAQRLIDHHRTEVGAADADVDDVGDGFSGVSLPLSAAEAVGELAHPGEDLVHVGDDVLAVDGQCRIGRQAQRGVQDGAVLGGVDVGAGEHVVADLLETDLAGQAHQEFEGLAQHPVLGVVDVQIADVDGEFAPARGIDREHLTQVHGVHMRLMSRERLPGLRRGDVAVVGAGEVAARCLGAHDHQPYVLGVVPATVVTRGAQASPDHRVVGVPGPTGQRPSGPRPRRSSSIARVCPSWPRSWKRSSTFTSRLWTRRGPPEAMRAAPIFFDTADLRLIAARITASSRSISSRSWSMSSGRSPTSDESSYLSRSIECSNDVPPEGRGS